MKRIHPKEELCMACHLCEVHCLVEHSRSKDPIKAYRKESPRPSSRLRVQRRGIVSFALSCLHCADPQCVSACLSGALQKDPVTGVVWVDEERCLGCWTCVLACPYGAIFPDPSKRVAAKCDLCPHLPQPACVASCPNQALVYAEVG